MIVIAVTLLPQPDSPTTPSVSAPVEREGDAVDGLDDAVHDVEMGPQVAHIEQRRRVPARRSRPSRGSVIGVGGHVSQLLSAPRVERVAQCRRR